MIARTEAYANLKQQSDALFDFAVVMAYAVPSLKKEIKLALKDDQWRVPRPDYFKHDKSSLEDIQARAQAYKPRLASYIVISIFSFFEAYVVDAITEMIDFHGGKEEFASISVRRSTASLDSEDKKILSHKRRLQEPIKTSKQAKYRKHTKGLEKAGYRFPSEILSAFGVEALYSSLRNLRASGIPDILKHGLQVDISEKEIARFHQIKNARHRIAHGKKVTVSLREAMNMNQDLHKMAVRIDKHLVENFFVIEKFA